MRTVYFILISALVSLSAVQAARAQGEPDPEGETFEEPYTLSITILNKKGKPFRSSPVSINVAGEAEFYPVPESGRVEIPQVFADDVLNVFAGSQLYNVNVGGFDSLSIVFMNPRKLKGVYNGDRMIDTGFGEVSAANNTQAYGTVDLHNADHYSSLLDYLKGRIAGVEVTGGTIRVRGINSINSGTEPLMVVDGVTMDVRSANALVMPRDIESITVDKTGSMYGVRGANGVIIIKTKTAAN
ncbi:MAG: hypothetical protein LIO85_01310 [Rikenellaceae bacterium]|nr:hypothetical protein [Rikenellaceae bacterium]